MGLFEKVLISNLTENNIEKYNIELDYYSVCFSKNDYKELFGKDKNSEKDLLFKFIDEACALNNFDYTNPDFKRFIEEFKYTLKTFPDFNQPIEYNCKNINCKMEKRWQVKVQNQKRPALLSREKSISILKSSFSFSAE